VLKVINRATLETTHEIGGSSDFARDEDDRTTQHADRTALHAGWTPDGTLIVMGMKKVFSFDYKTQRACVVPPRLTPGFNSKQSIALSAYGQHVAYSCSSNLPGQSKAVQMLVVETVGYARAKLPAFTFKLGEDGSLLKVAFSPDNSKLAALTASRLVVFDNDRNNGWKKRADLALKSAATFAWSASAKSIAVWLASTVVSLSADNLASQEVREHNSVFAYDLGRLGRDFAGQGLGDEAKLRTLAGPIVVAIGGRKMQAAPKLSPDGRTVAAGGNGKLALIDTTTMEATEAHEVKGWVYGLAWAPDSQTLAIGSYDKTVTVLNVVANVVVARCGERGYFPEALAFSQNCGMLVDGGGSSTKAQFAVYSCDSSRLPLIEPTDSAPMLRAQQPGTKRSDFDVKRRGAVMDLIDVYPAIALNPLPSGDLSLQPAAGGASRMADVLAHRTERDLLEELVERIPALAVLPSGGRKHPTFTIALKQRDVRTLRVLLVAGARAPIAARSILATKLIPAIVQMRMGSAVTAFLQQVALEESGASITSGCHRDGTPLVQDDVLELHPTHGGAGTSIWLGHHEDPSKLKALLDARKGIEQGKEEAIESMGFVSGLFARARRALFAALTSASAYTPLGEKPAASYTRAYNALASAIERVPNDDLRLFLKLQVLVLVPQPDGEIAATRSRVGTEVQAMRVPIPGLSSRACLEGLCRIGLNGTFDNALMRPTVHCLWRNHFFIAHLVKSLLHAVHVAALAVYIIEIASGNRFYDNEWSARLLYAVAGICVMSAYVVFFELRQLLGFQLHHGLVSGTIMYVCSFWNIGDLLTALVPLYAIALDAAGGAIDEGHVHVKGLLACSAILMFMRSAQLLQGFELTGWLVMVLMQNVIDMVGFIVLVSTSIFFFSLAFLMLFVDADGGERGYRQAWHSLMSTFTMGVFADFDVHVLDGGNTINTPMSVTLFVLFMVIVGVVSLNALIAFLGDSYAKVQDRQVEATLSLKARLIVGTLRRAREPRGRGGVANARPACVGPPKPPARALEPHVAQPHVAHGSALVLPSLPVHRRVLHRRRPFRAAHREARRVDARAARGQGRRRQILRQLGGAAGRGQARYRVVQQQALQGRAQTVAPARGPQSHARPNRDGRRLLA
jgi:hypothetical protein